MRNLETMTTNPRYAGGSLDVPVAEDLTPGEAAVLGMEGFEKPAVVLLEDQRRLGRLRWVLPAEAPLGWPEIGNVAALNEHRHRYPSRPLTVLQLDRAEVLGLIGKLEANTEAESAICSTLASSIAMATVRVRVIGAILTAFENYQDGDLATVTVAKGSWVYRPDELLAVDAGSIKRALMRDLRRTAVSLHLDPLVGFLHGEYEPTTGVYVLHWHLMTTAAKAALLAEALRGLPNAYEPTDLVKRPIRVSRVGDRVGQATYMLKSFWPQRAIRTVDGEAKRDRGYHRICEPWSSIYLLWLDRHRLLDLTVATGTWSRRKGGSEAWEAFSLMVEGQGRKGASGADLRRGMGSWGR